MFTHDHPDHLHLEALQTILGRSGTEVIGNGEVAARLGEEGIRVTVMEEGTRQVGAFTLQAIPAAHELILSDATPRNTAFLVNGLALNCGDSFQDPLLAFRGVRLLVLPVMAPFLTELGVMDFARRMVPEAVLPVYDGYAKPFFLTQRYETYAKCSTKPPWTLPEKLAHSGVISWATLIFVSFANLNSGLFLVGVICSPASASYVSTATVPSGS